MDRTGFKKLDEMPRVMAESAEGRILMALIWPILIVLGLIYAA